MTVNRKLYPSKTVWDAMRRERLEQVGFVCEWCGLPDATEFYNANKPHPFYQHGTPYRMYLQFAHKRQPLDQIALIDRVGPLSPMPQGVVAVLHEPLAVLK